MEYCVQSQLIAQSVDVAEALAFALLERGGTTEGKIEIATTLDSFVHTIVKLSETDGAELSQATAERINSLAGKVFEAFPAMIALSDGYHLSDVNARFWVARYILEPLETLVESSLLSAHTLDVLSDEMHEQLKSVLEVAVVLMNPATFEFGYVPDAWVQSGYRATGIAAQLSRIFTRADAKARESHVEEHIAA